ncbi:MAG: hypothetical protein JWN68_677 [Nocardioides sp.]|jgi:hypothetical protein|uniref:hypothetical protein n=1 Tax=Nocardioides sp. TaxID=35761 RepID=UPI002620319E|nr:hypothetical protein [Nocardioides sp.]MCW2832724.1 hypothetical protein [Nocardioides sp.]
MLMTVARLAIAALLAMSGVVLATAAPAFACKCDAVDVKQQSARVDAVFVGEVQGVTETERQFEYAVLATHTFKGTVERDTAVVTNQDTAACGLGELKNGTAYVFLVTGAAAPYTATSCDGSGPANDKRLAEVEAVLGAGTEIAEPPPPAPTLTKVEESGPPSLGRLAAPGGALVLVGFLGLLVVGRLART